MVLVLAVLLEVREDTDDVTAEPETDDVFFFFLSRAAGKCCRCDDVTAARTESEQKSDAM